MGMARWMVKSFSGQGRREGEGPVGGHVSEAVDATILEPSQGWKERGGAEETAYPCICYDTALYPEEN